MSYAKPGKNCERMVDTHKTPSTSEGRLRDQEWTRYSIVRDTLPRGSVKSRSVWTTPSRSDSRVCRFGLSGPKGIPDLSSTTGLRSMIFTPCSWVSWTVGSTEYKSTNVLFTDSWECGRFRILNTGVSDPHPVGHSLKTFLMCRDPDRTGKVRPMKGSGDLIRSGEVRRGRRRDWETRAIVVEDNEDGRYSRQSTDRKPPSDKVDCQYWVNVMNGCQTPKHKNSPSRWFTYDISVTSPLPDSNLELRQ